MYRGNNVNGMTATGRRHWPPRVGHTVQVRRRVRRVPKQEGNVEEVGLGGNGGTTGSAGSTGLIGGCSGTRYGCCPDGVTAKVDEAGLNCPGSQPVGGCAGTRYGCCPDGVTARVDAEGRNCEGGGGSGGDPCQEEAEVVYVGPNRTPVIGQCVNENGTLVCRFAGACENREV